MVCYLCSQQLFTLSTDNVISILMIKVLLAQICILTSELHYSYNKLHDSIRILHNKENSENVSVGSFISTHK
jgi:hypothetical protein